MNVIRLLVIGNPAAHGGRARELYDEYLSFLNDIESVVYQGYITKKPNDHDGMDLAIQEFSPNIISIIGGDGTINDVVNVDSALTCDLHLIPGGSGNDFSKLINGSQSKIEAFELVTSPKRKLVDTGICNEQRFLNGVGLGFDGSIARQTVRMKLPFSTSWKYWIAIMKNILFYRSTIMRFRFNGKELSDKTFMVSVANGAEYGGGFRVSPESDPSDGLLNLVIIGKIFPLMRLFYVPIVEKGNHLSISFISHELTDEVDIVSDSIIYAHIDGELMSSRAYKIRVSDKISLVCKA